MPYRFEEVSTDTQVRLMLVTSRETKRWVIPKGNLSASMLPHLSAAREAEEEAGVAGAVFPTPFGSFRYRKKRGNGASLMVEAVPLLRDVARNGTRLHELTERLVRMEAHADE
ncbi:MAG: DUF47 domain-containing protein, partial [Novosphingobium sp.]|nr:DUF47 domain-containing protein [Novosphingobium sp.]